METYDDIVTRRDFAELREVVADLAASEKRLAIAQERTEARVEELAVTQTETQTELQKLAASHDRLAASHEQTQSDVHELTRIASKRIRSDSCPHPAQRPVALRISSVRMIATPISDSPAINPLDTGTV